MSKFRDPNDPANFPAISNHGLASLLRALHTDEALPLTCAECREHLAALHHKLYDTPQAAPPLTELEQAAASHLTTCDACRAEFDALHDAMTALANGTLPELSRPHQFDLSFLAAPAPTTPAATPAALWAQGLAEKAWRLVDAIHIQVEAARAAFSALPTGLTPTLTTAAAMRADGDEGQAELLVLPAADATFSIHLTVGPLIAGKAVVTVKLVNVENAQPLQNALVALRNSERQLLLGRMSGEDGSAILEPLARGRYFIQVQSNQQTWEVPLVIMGGSPLA